MIHLLRVGLLLGLLGAAASAQVATSSGDTVLVSEALGGGPGSSGSREPKLAAGGRWLVFSSAASDLVPGDDNGADDVFVRDLLLGTTELVSVALGGGPGHGASGNGYAADISADGRYVAFESFADDLVAGDANGQVDVFRRDRLLGVTVLVSAAAAGGFADAGSWDPVISNDGQAVAFISHASDLVPGFNGHNQVYRADLLAGTTSRCSVDAAGAPANDGCMLPAISGDGRVVAFATPATNLPGGTGFFEVFVRVHVPGFTELASVNAAGVPADNQSTWPALSADGQLVAFQSYATNLVPGTDMNGMSSDVYLRNRTTNQVERINLTHGYIQPQVGAAFRPALSQDGRRVAFESNCIALAPPDANGVETDIYVRDRRLATTVRVSVDGAGLQGPASSASASLDATGRLVTFRTDVSSFTAGDLNEAPDVYVHDLGPWTNLQGALAGGGGEPVLVGVGLLGSQEPAGLALHFAAPLAPALLFLATASVPAPFKGGTLLAHPVTVLVPLATDAQGGFALSFAWPPGVPSGFSFVLQAAVADAGAPQGVALSNALEALVP